MFHVKNQCYWNSRVCLSGSGTSCSSCPGLLPGKGHHPNRLLLPSSPKWKQSWMVYASPTPPCLSVNSISSQKQQDEREVGRGKGGKSLLCSLSQAGHVWWPLGALRATGQGAPPV